jgi:D-alanyl-D-alanine carboxypeptidase
MLALPAAPPPFVARVEHVTAAELGASWHRGCPVPPAQLRLVRLRYFGFDGKPHLGALVVNSTVVSDVARVFGTLYSARFPIRRMRPVSVYGGSDDRSMAADNTSAFNCRYAVAPGPKTWSVHAFGEAVDVNTVENPYVLGGAVLPKAGKPFLDRTNVRPGMAVAGGPLVQAFALVGWLWGGRWTDSPDYQHFSVNGK